MRERNFGFIFRPPVFIFCLFFLFADSSQSDEDVKSRQTYVIRYKDGEQTIPVTVVLDYKKQTEYVINMNPRSPAKSVTLYDFKQKTIAYKDLTNRECFLGRLTFETLNEENNALQDVKNPVEVRPKLRSLDPRKPALTPTEIRNIAGQKTAVFCRNMNTWLLMPEKTHSIGKRDTGEEYEERTLQYHGHRSSQYSHYERETRRRFRNGGQVNSKRRSHRKKSEAGNRNDGHTSPGSNAYLPNLSNQSPNAVRFSNPGNPINIDRTKIESHSTYQQLPQSSDHGNFNYGQENYEIPIPGRFPTEPPSFHRHFEYQDLPNTETRSASADSNTPSAKSTLNQSHNFSSIENDDNPVYDHEIKNGFSKNAFQQHQSSKILENLSLHDSKNDADAPTTANIPFIPHEQSTYPNVHSSLIHLLPVYKPLSEEFNFEQKAGTENPQPYQQKNIESEGNPLPTALIEPNYRLNHFEDRHDTPHDPDVSVNILEFPRITKEFENIKRNESFIPLSELGNSKQIHTSVENYPSQTPVQSNPSSYYQRNSLQQENHKLPEYSPVPSNKVINKAINESFRSESRFYNPYSELTTTTDLPVLTTPKYSTAERTTPDAFYNPPIHTAFKNSEDIDSFQIYTNFIENDVNPTVKTNTIIHATNVDRRTLRKGNEDSRILQHLVLTTVHPLREEKLEPNMNQRSDIPNESMVDQLQLNSVATDKRASALTTLHNFTDESVLSYDKRYQSVLRNFKPEEILIDIGNVATYTPSPFTASFHQRVITTIQPTIKSSSPNDTSKYADRRSEQNSGTTWRSLHPPTRYPRRRLHEKPRRPSQNTSLLHTQRGSLNQNYYPAPPVNQFVGVSRFSSVHQRNHRQFYPSGSRPIPPPRTHIQTELNQIQHIGHLGNLPPGVSIHPRHPQAPLADMVLSNRPPTLPLASDDQSLLKPHRQRHHRRKEKHLNSCCRLRGQASAFQSCCRNGNGPCCSRTRRRMHAPGASPCCSSSNVVGQIAPPNQIQPLIAAANQIFPPVRTEETHRSEMDNKDRCLKEKMCRTLYESTQQVMVCRNADIEGC